MRFCSLIILCTVLVTTCADPEPKKYKSEVKDKDKLTNATLTSDEKKFLRDVETKFGIKSDAPAESNNNNTEGKSNPTLLGQTSIPAVIAIEIVNDTDTKTKGKRTIDANLGYGYKTNAGYTYTYFGKPAQDKGKFMIYPYSQENIPSGNYNNYQNIRNYDRTLGKHLKTSVQIQPSQAFELVPVKDEHPAYNYRKPAVEFKTPYDNARDTVPHYTNAHGSAPSTLYTTYNGEQFSGLTGQFPSVMSNYLVDPSQLLKNPEYQNVGLTQDHLHGTHLEQKVVPVLVLRIPSSSLTNPSAELYANLPHNYPLSNYLNNVNLQELVNQYFKKIGYKFAPQVSYSNSHSSEHVEGSVSQYEPQHYAHPYVQPSYTQAHFSGVQYSAVQPVMARYPSSYVSHDYTVPKGQSLYKPPSHQNYDYQYQYVPQSQIPSQKYYYQPQYQQQVEQATTQEVQNDAPMGHGPGIHDSNVQVQYESPAVVSSQETGVTSNVEYGVSHPYTVQYATAVTAAPEYGTPKEEHSQSLPQGYDTKTTAYESPKQSTGPQVYYQNQVVQEETSAIVQPRQRYPSHSDSTQNYVYQQQGHEEPDNGLILTENYPSKDHTIATVLPSQYKAPNQNVGAVQSVSYVTPTPYSSKYKLPYNVIVPQTYLHNPTTEKVAYVNSQTLPSYSQTMIHQEYNPESEYTVGYHYVPPVGKQKPPSYPRNYHSHKRMVKSENKQESSATSIKNKNNSSEKKRS